MRFPYYIFNPRNSANLNWRASNLCQYLLSKRHVPTLSIRPDANFTYLTLVCRRDLPMMRISLESLAKHAVSLPELVVVHDKSLSSADTVASLDFWPSPVHCYDRDQVAKYHADRGETRLAEFCQLDIFGFKLAAIFMCAASNRCLYADCDVLWLTSCNSIMGKYASQPAYASVDAGNYPYDHGLMGFVRRHWGTLYLEPPHGNAGVCLVNSAQESFHVIQPLLDELLSHKQIHRLSEQTMVSILAKRYRAFISPEDVHMEWALTHGASSFRGMPWVARHYAGPSRPQFWIDAYHLFRAKY